jgi:NADPH-dependent F420 reductase
MLGFIGGTGPEGRGLALRFALADESLIVGSRDATRAQDTADAIAATVPDVSIQAGLNHYAADRADTVFVTVPYSGQRSTLESIAKKLAGKIVVITVAPLSFGKDGVSASPVEAGSAAAEASQVLHDSRVVAAFQTISAHDLLKPKKSVDSDVVVCSDDQDAKETVMTLAEKIVGVRAVDGGGLRNAAYVEQITVLLLNINRIYKAHSAIKIIGI